jgi:hypothetical protein
MTTNQATPQPCVTCAWCRFNMLLHGRAYLSLCTRAKEG